MKALLCFALMLFTFSPAKADDLADAKAAFNTLLEYQKRDDIRSLDLFAADCSIVFTLTDGKAYHETIYPAQTWRGILKQAIAQKKGCRDTYQDVKFAKEGAAVRVTANVTYPDTGTKGPFSALYSKDAKGVMKIKKMNATTVVKKLPQKQASAGGR